MDKKLPITPETILDFAVDDPEEFTRNMLTVFEAGTKAVTQYLERPDAQIGAYSNASELSEFTKTFAEVFSLWMQEPARVADAQSALMSDYMRIWENTMRRMLGEDVEPVAEPEPGDPRFKDEAWTANPFFDFWKQSYLVTSRWTENVVDQVDSLNDTERMKAEFHFRLFTSALSPSNFPATNPEVLRETFRSNAQNFVVGMNQFMKDMEKSGDLLTISQTDTKAFEIGRNLAMTPGKIVFQNDLLQLIQYTPTTEKVHKTPILMVPPWINKFYVLDLTPQKSFIKFAVDQGFTVFVISWVNPDESLAKKSFEDYMIEGVLEAADAARRETGVKKLNALGYCVGGTLLATTLTYLAARGEEIFKSATFLTTQVDFSKAGDLLVFTDNDQLEALEEIMDERGYLDGSRMANVFNMMRSRDLIWPYVVNNYLLGKQPFPFDLLYWNQDSTRMPAANHKFYLRAFYNENRLAKCEMKIGGTPLDVGKVSLPVYELATKEDHIAPAQSVFIGSQLFGGPVEFVLSGSGHIAGVVNPPEKMKYQHWIGGDRKAGDLMDWLESATEEPGSWWPHWANWLASHSGKKVDAREPGANLGVIEDAPGSYVKVK